MREFLKPWRRKAGCVMLVMACAFAAGWVRSLSKCDIVFLPTVCIVASANGKFTISSIVRVEGQLSGGGIAQVAFESTSFLSRPELLSYELKSIEIIQPRMTPYSSTIIPLTMLSAYLLFSKPGTRIFRGER